LKPVLRYLLKRAADRLILFVASMIFLFLFIRVVPIWYYGEDPFITALRFQVGPARGTEVVVAELVKQYGLDKPIFPDQFITFMKNLVTLDFGVSFYSRQPVWEEIALRLPNTLALTTSAFILNVLIGFYLGWYSTARRGRMADSIVMQASIWSFIVPAYLMAIVLLILLAYLPKLYGITLFPLPPLTPPPPKPVSLGFIEIPLPGFDFFYYLSLPVMSIVVAGFGGLAYYVRQLTVSELGQDYIVTARAKGLDEDTIMRRHVFRNVRPPVVTALTLSIPGLFGGLIITERIFSYYGMGLYFIQALENNDYPAIAALFYLFTLLTVIALYLVDILVAVFDPRVRLEGR